MEELHSYPWAVEQLRLGKRVCRKGWNGKNMFIYLTPGTYIDHNDLRDDLKPILNGKVSEKVKINPHIDMKGADGSLTIGWVASQVDTLSYDWMLV